MGEYDAVDLRQSARTGRRLPFIILMLTIVASLLTLTGSVEAPMEPTRLEKIISNPKRQQGLTVLLVGIDRDRYFSRADTVMLAFVEPMNLEVKIISLPRDTRVRIPGRGYNKLNAAFAIGGISMLREVVSELVGVPVDYHIATNLQGFINLVDLLGGVEVEVEKDLYYVDRADGLEIDIKAGLRKLDGRNAMHFVRYRDPIYADIGRIQRQQQFVKAMISQALSLATVPRIPAMVRNALQNVDTDFSAGEILDLGQRFIRFRRPNLQFSTAPGTAEYVGRVAYYLVDVDQLRDIAISVADNAKTPESADEVFQD